MTDAHPKIENAPGLKWRKIKHGWQAIWRARSDLVTRGYPIKSHTVWRSTAEQPEIDPTMADAIASECQDRQAEMMVWANGGIPWDLVAYDGTWAGLVRQYQNDPDSPYHKKRYATREYYDTLCRRIVKDCGSDKVEDTDARKLLRLHEGWSADGKVAMGHAVVGMLRTLTTFGATLLKCPACRTLRPDLRDMRIKAAKPREQHLSAEQATALRAHAHTTKPPRPSIALAQAIQFDGTLRQKDVIGEWVPVSEIVPPTDIVSGNEKWCRGIRWDEIDKNMILRHVTSKRDKMLVLDLRLCPMVMDELRHMAGHEPDAPVDRGIFPASGAFIVNETTGRPWTSVYFRGTWRKIARACGIPDNVKNMDSRAGAITEALDAGAPMDAVRKGATHSNISMTQRYSRGDAQAVSVVLQHRAAHRNKDGTK